MAAGEGSGGRAPYERVRDTVTWSKALGRRICRRVAGGELLYAVLSEAGMPTPQSVGRWAKEKPDFGRALAEARRASGRPPEAGGGGVWLYSEGLAREVFERLCEGESLTAIGADPTMPCLSTLFNWRARFPDFDAQVELAKRVQAERCCDDGLALAAEITPETAYATHVRLTHMRWAAGVMAPRVYRLKAAEPPAPPRTVKVVSRRYAAEIHPETGERRMVTYAVVPGTGEVTKTWSETPLREPCRTHAEAAAEGGADDVDAWV